MADTTHTNTTPTGAPKDKTLWKNGAGVGAAIGTAICSVITIGLGCSRPLSTNPADYLLPVALVTLGAFVGALLGGIVGWAVPVAETKTDTQIGIH